MENSSSITPSAPVTPVELIKRQIRDWNTLKAQLEEQNAKEGDHERYNNIAYCESIIETLESELHTLIN